MCTRTPITDTSTRANAASPGYLTKTATKPFLHRERLVIYDEYENCVGTTKTFELTVSEHLTREAGEPQNEGSAATPTALAGKKELVIYDSAGKTLRSRKRSRQSVTSP